MNRILANDFEELYTRRFEWDNLNKATVLISGAYGMLASYMLMFLCYLGEHKGFDIKIIAVVRSREKFCRRLPEYGKMGRIEIYESCMLSPLEIEGKVDYIIHAASPATPNCFSTAPVDVIAANTVGTYHLLELAVRKKVKGFLLFSSGDVYGDTGEETEIKESTLGKIDTLDMHSCYGEGKRAAETMCMCYYKQYGVPVKIARLAHTYSPTMEIKKDSRVFASFVKNIMEGKNIVMYSDGKAFRSFCYVEDAAYGFFMILLTGASGEAYNVCSEQQIVSIRELAETLAGIYPEKGIKVVQRERDRADAYLPNKVFKGHVAHLSNEKLRRLGWEEKVGIREGFKRVLAYLEIEREFN